MLPADSGLKIEAGESRGQSAGAEAGEGDGGRVCYVNGGLVPEAEARISILDHALLYGDGVFDTVIAWDGRLFRLDDHIDRLFRSMAAVAIPTPVSREELRDLTIRAVRANKLDNAYVKWIVTRGSNDTPLMDPAGCAANLIILVRPYIHRYAPDSRSGLRLKTAAIRRPPGQVLSPQIKSLNYLNLVLAKIEAKSAQADEALLLDIHGRVCEAPGYNVFVASRGTLLTPQHDILEGITRASVMEIAAQQAVPLRICDVELYDAYAAEEVFLTSTAGGLVPVVEVDGRVIGEGRPGPLFARFSKAYQEMIASPDWGTAVHGEQKN
ncbi:branched-chain amino acid aminotransferase [Pelagibius litoralis]|uniref:Probable branched-chain-amino-acid aminotransferase n=1 Tax=Pelagibius litoralis TaxID=374515 RepID=A0A967KDI2_9PROT|nr:aminotransferase class IV [Pelagibius litoralis]NIA72267.1 branched-chain amino acid aminotransferase [Pelagibius litoralis]